MASDVSETTAVRVRTLRREKQWSIDDLAERCPSLTVPALYALESGRREQGTGRRRRHVTVDELVELAEALGVQPVELLGEADDPSGNEEALRIGRAVQRALAR